MIIAAAFCGWYSLQRSRINTSHTAQEEIAAGTEIFRQFGADELSMIFNEFETHGLGRKERPEFYLWNAYAKDLEYRASVWGAIAGLFAVITLGIWISARMGRTPPV